MNRYSYLCDEEGRLGDPLLRDEQPRVGHADVEVRAQDGVLAAGLGARQEVDGQRLAVVPSEGKKYYFISLKA